MSWNQPCEACREAAATCSCTKLVKHYVICSTVDLVVGDLTCRIGEREPKPGVKCTVVDVKRSPEFGHHTFAVTLSIRRGSSVTTKVINRLGHSTLRRAMDGPCNRALCEVCAQDPGDPHRYCPDHWLRATALEAA